MELLLVPYRRVSKGVDWLPTAILYLVWLGITSTVFEYESIFCIISEPLNSPYTFHRIAKGHVHNGCMDYNGVSQSQTFLLNFR